MPLRTSYTHYRSCYISAHMQMSKSRGNVVNPDEVVMEFGADSLRLYEMFMGPLRETKVWPLCHHQSCLVIRLQPVTTRAGMPEIINWTRTTTGRFSNSEALSMCAGMEHKGGGGGAPVPGAFMASHNRRCDGLRAVTRTAAPAAYDHQTGIWLP